MAKIRPDRRGVRLDALPAGSPGILKSAQQAEAQSDNNSASLSSRSGRHFNFRSS